MLPDDRFERRSCQSAHDDYLDADEEGLRSEHPCKGLLQALDELCMLFAGQRGQRGYDTRDSGGSLFHFCTYLLLGYIGYSLTLCLHGR